MVIDFQTVYILAKTTFFSIIPAIGFAIIFNVPKHLLVYVAILAGIGGLIKMILLLINTPVMLVSFITALTIGWLGIIIGKRLHTIPKIMTVAAIIPMFPGVYAYTAMIALIRMTNYTTNIDPVLFNFFLQNFLQALSIVITLSIGLTLPSTWLYRKEKQELDSLFTSKNDI